MSRPSSITYDEQARTWLISTRSTSYAFCVSDEGTLRHLHWGASIDLATAAALAAEAGGPALRRERDLAWSEDAPDEYVGWGGMRYDEPTLKVRYADGDRSARLTVAGHRIVQEDGATLLEIDLVDGTWLTVTLCYRAAHGFDVLERWVRIRNTNADPVDLDVAFSGSLWLPRRDAAWRLRYLHGGWASESRLGSVTLADPGKFMLESRRGTGGHQHSPWLTLDPDGTATEESGEVWSIQLAWSGSWKLVTERTSAGRIHVTGGWNDFDLTYRLAAGAEATLPVLAALHTTGGLGGASREWHAWTCARVLGTGDHRAGVPRWEIQPRPRARPALPDRMAQAAPWRPVLYNSWEATAFDVTEHGQGALAERAAAIGVELFVVDDGWFSGRSGDKAGLGDWYVDAAKFPRGLDPLIQRVHGHGMGFGLWVEPEMVNRDSELFRAHPEWVYHFTGREPTERRNQLMLNLARPDVADFVFTTLDRLLTDHDIGFVKWDANRNIADAGWPGHPNPERLWVDHTMNLYAVLDALRDSHPGVSIEGCAGGGGRIDLGMLARVDEVWPSDNTEPSMRWPIQVGYSQAFPPAAMASWVTDWPNPVTGCPLPLAQRFHVAMAGVLGIGGDLTKWSDAELAEAAEDIARYKQIRPVVQGGRLFRHEGAWEYVAPDGDEVVVIAFHEARPIGNNRSRVRLSGIDPHASYRDDISGTSYDGVRLLGDGLPLPLEAGFGYDSALVRLVRDEEERR